MLIVVEYSEASIGVVAPFVALRVVASVPLALTMTQLLPLAPGVDVNVNPARLDGVCICAVVRPVPAAEVA